MSNLNHKQATAVMGAVTVLVGECADTTARELLGAFLPDANEVEHIIAQCKHGYWRDCVPILLAGSQ